MGRRGIAPRRRAQPRSATGGFAGLSSDGTQIARTRNRRCRVRVLAVAPRWASGLGAGPRRPGPRRPRLGVVGRLVRRRRGPRGRGRGRGRGRARGLVARPPASSRSTAAPAVSVTVALSSTAASALRRATSCTIEGIWPCWSMVWANSLGSMPYCWALMTRYSMSSGCSTRTSSFSAMASRRNWALQRLAGALVDLGAVLVVVEAVLALEVLVHLGLDDAVGHGHVDGLEQVLEHLVAGLDALLVLLGLLGLRGDVGAQLVEGVELGGELGEVVVERGQLADLDRLHGDGALGVVALVVAAGQRCGEGLGLARGHAERARRPCPRACSCCRPRRRRR